VLRRGGRALLDGREGVKERPSERRVRQAAALEGVNVFVCACPKDLVMYREAAQSTGLDKRLVVKDIVELLTLAR